MPNVFHRESKIQYHLSISFLLFSKVWLLIDKAILSFLSKGISIPCLEPKIAGLLYFIQNSLESTTQHISHHFLLTILYYTNLNLNQEFPNKNKTNARTKIYYNCKRYSTKKDSTSTN